MGRLGFGIAALTALVLQAGSSRASEQAPESPPADGRRPSASATPAPRIDLLRFEPGARIDTLLGRVALRVVEGDRDTVYDLAAVDEGSVSLLALLSRGLVVRVRARTFAEVTSTLGGSAPRFSGRQLFLGAEGARALAQRLSSWSGPTPLERPFDPFQGSSARLTAVALDDTLGGALSAQATLPVGGDRRAWVLATLGERPLLRGLASLLLPPALGTPSAWDRAFLPEGLERVLDRATLDGTPLVTARYGAVLEPTLDALHSSAVLGRPGPETAILTSFIAVVAVLARARPRLAALVWGLVAGAIGVTVATIAVAAGWSDVDAHALLLAPPTHLGLAVVASSGRLWRRMRGACIAYLAVALVAACAAIATWAFGLAPPVSPELATASVGLDAVVALGVLRRRAVHRSPSRIPQGLRALTPIEERSPYLRAGGLRMRS